MPRKNKTRSKFEGRVDKCLQTKKAKYEYEPFRVPYIIPASNHNYIPDFVLDNGIVLEAKGLLDPQTRKKMLLVIAQNPDLDIRMIFMRDNTINRKSKTRYSTWAEKNNIKYTVSLAGNVPDEWIAEKKNETSLEVERVNPFTREKKKDGEN